MPATRSRSVTPCEPTTARELAARWHELAALVAAADAPHATLVAVVAELTCRAGGTPPTAEAPLTVHQRQFRSAARRVWGNPQLADEVARWVGRLRC